MAICYNRAGERMIILGIREAYIQRFEASDWLDLRIGFFLSICDIPPNDNVTNAALMEEGIANTDGLGSEDRFWIGLKTSDRALPRTGTTVFMGYTNSQHAEITRPDGKEDLGDTKLGLIGGAGDYWLPFNPYDASWCAGISEGPSWRSFNVANHEQFFARDPTIVLAGYAALFGIRLTRNASNSTQITMSMRADPTVGSDILFSNTPDIASIQSNLTTFPTDVGVYGPIYLNAVPDALYFYWPFHKSRLRIHSVGILKAS